MDVTKCDFYIRISKILGWIFRGDHVDGHDISESVICQEPYLTRTCQVFNVDVWGSKLKSY